MLPGESLPILRNQEVYRMPSVSSIFAVFYKDSNHKEQVERNLVPFPSIDPLDAFYLLNPGGDLVRTQIQFENYFRDKNLEVLHMFKFDKNTWKENFCLLVFVLVVLSTQV
jgi:separase